MQGVSGATNEFSDLDRTVVGLDGTTYQFVAHVGYGMSGWATLWGKGKPTHDPIVTVFAEGRQFFIRNRQPIAKTPNASSAGSSSRSALGRSDTPACAAIRAHSELRSSSRAREHVWHVERWEAAALRPRSGGRGCRSRPWRWSLLPGRRPHRDAREDVLSQVLDKELRPEERLIVLAELARLRPRAYVGRFIETGLRSRSINVQQMTVATLPTLVGDGLSTELGEQVEGCLPRRLANKRRETPGRRGRYPPSPRHSCPPTASTA
jgi:hypothetical protein